MKCRIFWGCVAEAKDQFNKWANGKNLTREIIIHEQITYGTDTGGKVQLLIIVYHPDSLAWNVTKSEPIQPVQRETNTEHGMEREAITA
jgi:hypothetical protein